LISNRLACVLTLGTALSLPGQVRADDLSAAHPALPELVPGRAFEPIGMDAGGDGRRTLGAFGSNLGRNVLGVASGRNLRPFLLGVGAAGAGSFLDGRSERFFVQHPAPRFGTAGRQLGQATVLAPAVAMLLVSGRASRDQRFRAATYDAAQAFVVTGLYTTAFKLTVGRERPDASNRLSFPSGHTSSVVTLATVVDHHYGHRLGIPAYAVAGLVGVSRIESKAHHLSDVLAGATIGYLVGRTVVRQDGEPAARSKRLSLGPAFPAQGSGVGLSVSLQF
jgi:membrane-associated phospholipid phosphatase